jgi:hypothetical protein
MNTVNTISIKDPKIGLWNGNREIMKITLSIFCVKLWVFSHLLTFYLKLLWRFVHEMPLLLDFPAEKDTNT